jgi:FAD/FMN-containing dehydrogenase
VFATAEPEDGEDRWRLRIGFEGFRTTVAAQLTHAETLLEKSGFRPARAEDYDVISGPFGEMYGRIADHPWVLRAGVPPDRAARAARVLQDEVRAKPMLVDFGCGRVLAGSSEMSAAAWNATGRRMQELAGHIVLDKAPDEFKQGVDVFGPQREEWKLMHRVKDILDPKHIFAPGRMPGKV